MKRAVKYLLVVCLMIFLAGCGKDVSSDNGTEVNDTPHLTTEAEQGTFYRKGASNPVVVMEEYSDLFCPHCSDAQPILDQLIEDFKDKLALEFHHYSFMGSIYVHVANECAGEQGKFWEFHQAAFEAQNDLRLATNVNKIIELGTTIGLDKEKFSECVDNGKYLNKVEAQRLFAKEQYQITGTPSFIIDGKLIELTQGESFYEGLKKRVEEAINKPLA